MTLRTTRVSHITAMLLITVSFADARDQTDLLICPQDPVFTSPSRVIRAMSLDLQGRLPNATEEAGSGTMSDDDPVPDALVDTMLAGEEFPWQVVRHHRQFFWNNISQADLVSRNQEIGNCGGIICSRTRTTRYRGERNRFCADRPAEFDPQTGDILTAPDDEGNEVEGWVEVSPYWAPDSTIKVCAYDAQTNLYSEDGTDCRTRNGTSKTDCGCGPGLAWCLRGQELRAVKRAFGKSLEYSIHAVIDRNESYLELFENRRMFVNGPLVHFYQYQATGSGGLFNPLAVDVDRLPDLDYSAADTWTEMQLGGEHAGVLTHPAYLFRFMTNRARATRFFEAFLCSPFQPPSAGLPEASAESALNPDLQTRDGCKYCHAMLEPAAAHWGRWPEVSAGFLSPSAYMAEDPDCVECAMNGERCSAFCRANYLVRALTPQEEPFLGRLEAYTFRRQEHEHHVELGPKYLARLVTADHRLPDCVSRNTAEWLLGREMTETDQDWIDTLSRRFVRGGLNFRNLVKDVVQSEQYRRVR